MTAKTQTTKARTIAIGIFALLLLLAATTFAILTSQAAQTGMASPTREGIQVGSGEMPPSTRTSLLPGEGIQVGSGEQPPTSTTSLLPAGGIHVGSGDSVTITPPTTTP